MKETIVKKQMQWVLMHVQGEIANVWKENMMKDLEVGVLDFEIIGEFITTNYGEVYSDV